MSTLNLYARPAQARAARALLGDDLDALARGYRRTARATGGFWAAQFRLSQEDLARAELEDFYNFNLGCRLEESHLAGTAWDGIIQEMTLTRDGQSYRRSLRDRWWHNRVKVRYTDRKSGV